MRPALLTLLFVGTLHADLPSPRLDRLFPLGAAAGSAVEVEVSGADLDEPRALLFDHPGIKAEPLKDRKFKVTVGSDVPEGTYDARVVGKYGVSSPRLFAVSHGLAEVVEKEPNDDPATANAVAVNSAVSGTSDGNKDDVFKFPARKGQRVVLDCQAGKLDSMLDGTLTLTAADGKLLGSNSGYNGRDPLIDFVAPADGEYFVAVHDRSYRGGLPYRLVITDRPHVEAVFPRAVQAGKPTQVTVYGRNLGPGSKPSAWAVGELPLEEKEETVTAPADVLARGLFRFTDHPTTHSPLPTAATATLTGFQVHGIPVLVTADPVVREVEPNDDPKHPRPIALPAVVAGRFDKERDADWYEFDAPADGPYTFDVYCERIAGRADPYLVVLDDKDNRVAELDDFGPRDNAFDGHLRDPSGVVNLGGKKKYRVLVQDRYRRGGARYQYVLVVRKPVPDFDVAVIHSQNPGPGGTTVRKGGAAYLDVMVQRKGGFAGPITIAAEGLPKGLHAAPTTIPGESRGALVFWADADAPDFVGPVRLTATGTAGGGTLAREVRPYTRVWTSTDMNSSRPTRELVVAVAGTAPFALRPATDRVEVTAGRKAEVKFLLDRGAGFAGPVTVTPLTFPGSIKAGQATIAGEKTEAAMQFDVTAGTRPGEYTLVVRGQAQVPVDGPKGKGTTLAALPARPITLVVRLAGGK